MNPNNIKKNDPILVTRENGEIVAARATKVGPWSKNPMITLINYIFTDPKDGLMYASRADARKCGMGTNAMLPKEPEPAAVCPTMAGWTLGKTKRGPMMMEGYYFAIPVLFNGKKVGEIVDEGNGGDTNAEHFKTVELLTKFRDNIKAWLATNGAGQYTDEGDFWTWWDDARVKGKDAATYFKEKNAEMAKWMAASKAVSK